MHLALLVAALVLCRRQTPAKTVEAPPETKIDMPPVEPLPEASKTDIQPAQFVAPKETPAPKAPAPTVPPKKDAAPNLTDILPPSPGFYGHPQAIADLVDFVVARILDQLGVEHSLGPRWGVSAATPTIARA